MQAAELIAFEDEVAEKIRLGQIKTPTHLCGGNEEKLIKIFEHISPKDWIFATYRNHYHALLYGIPKNEVMAQILAGRSMTPHYPDRKFFTSAIVGGTLSIAVGVAMALRRKGAQERVWCFVGDMAAATGDFYEATRYAAGHQLPITFIVEDNELSCDTPTSSVWGLNVPASVHHYVYSRNRPHLGATQ